MKKIVKSTVIGAAVLASAATSAATWKAGNTDVTFKGYVKLDFVHVEGAGSSASLNKQITTPSQISADSKGGRNGFQVFQTRFGLGTSTPTEMGDAKTYIEMDYYLSDTGNAFISENISNSYNPRLRHAFFSVGKWTFGQTWSNFMILSALPDQLDFGGYTGINFARQGQIKYTTKMGAWTWETSVENAETTWAKGGTTLGTTTPAADQDTMPDFITKFTHSGDYGSVALGAMYRTHSSEEISEDDTAFALTTGGKFNYMGKNEVRFNLSWGNLGRYGSFTSFKDAVTDNSGSKEAVEATESLQWSVGVRHFLTEKTRVNAIYGVGKMDTFAASQIEDVDTIHVNLIRQPMKSFQYGVEWSQTNVTRFGATKTAAKAEEVTSNRYMFSAQYNF